MRSMVSSTADEMYSGVKTFITLSESKPPFSNQSYGDYNLECAHESTLVHIIIPFNALNGSVWYYKNPSAF